MGEWKASDWGVVAIFVVVYLGMILGGLPRLKLNRAGVALLGAITVVGMGAIDTEQAGRAIDLPTVLLLFSFMVVSAQKRLGGFYTAVTVQVAALPLGALILVAGSLSAVFSNDIVCLAMTPVVVRACLKRGFDPVPFLLGLACAANIGSAATLIGNPQNMLIGSVLRLPFAAYVCQALPPVGLSLLLLWAWLGWHLRVSGLHNRPHDLARLQEAGQMAREVDPVDAAWPDFNAWQTVKGLGVASALLVIFLLTDWPREVAALVGAGVLLLSRQMHSSRVMGHVDWELLVMFMGLFVVNHAFQATGLSTQVVALLAGQGVALADQGPLFVAGVGLSNLVSNVPAVMLLLPHLHGMKSGLTLALVSTYAGNLLLVGSIANLIVVDLAHKAGVRIDWRMHARVGLPVTLLTLAVLWVWL